MKTTSNTRKTRRKPNHFRTLTLFLLTLLTATNGSKPIKDAQSGLKNALNEQKFHQERRLLQNQNSTATTVKCKEGCGACYSNFPDQCLWCSKHYQLNTTLGNCFKNSDSKETLYWLGTWMLYLALALFISLIILFVFWFFYTCSQQDNYFKEAKLRRAGRLHAKQKLQIERRKINFVDAREDGFSYLDHQSSYLSRNGLPLKRHELYGVSPPGNGKGKGRLIELRRTALKSGEKSGSDYERSSEMKRMVGMEDSGVFYFRNDTDGDDVEGLEGGVVVRRAVEFDQVVSKSHYTSQFSSIQDGEEEGAGGSSRPVTDSYR